MRLWAAEATLLEKRGNQLQNSKKEKDKYDSSSELHDFLNVLFIYEPDYKAIDDENLYEDTVSKGIDFDKYFDVPVNVTGVDAPKGIKAFDDIELDKQLRENIEKCKCNV